MKHVACLVPAVLGAPRFPGELLTRQGTTCGRCATARRAMGAYALFRCVHVWGDEGIDTARRLRPLALRVDALGGTRGPIRNLVGFEGLGVRLEFFFWVGGLPGTLVANVPMCVCVCVCIHTYTYICIYIYIYAYIHTAAGHKRKRGGRLNR